MKRSGYAIVIVALALLLTIGGIGWASYATKVYMQQGGDVLVVDTSGMIKFTPVVTGDRPSTSEGGFSWDDNQDSPEVYDGAGWKYLAYWPKDIEAFTNADSPVTVSTPYVKSLVTNTGATNTVQFNLADASTWLGCAQTFVVTAAYAEVVNPADGDQILLLTNAAGDALSCATVGSTITLVAIGDNSIVSFAREGTWADAN